MLTLQYFYLYNNNMWKIIPTFVKKIKGVL